LDSAIDKFKSGKSFSKDLIENKMKYVFVDESWEDYLYWQKIDKKKVKKINDLLKDISRNPFEGIGKPEPLKHKYAGFWSRRIDDEHRLIYRLSMMKSVLKCRHHYD
jgi:toxin YoeB